MQTKILIKKWSRDITLVLFVFLLTSVSIYGQVEFPQHRLWTSLLQSHVDDRGMVSYEGMNKDSEKLDQYLKQLASTIPDENWTNEQSLAYWINAYNAFTIQLILDHHPTKSIMEIEKAWDKKFIELGGRKFSLNEIEHDIIRKEFQEPRIHFALVCGAVSCPVLLNRAYEAEVLDQQLEQQTKLFINDPYKNQLLGNKATVSQIFNWFKEDFTKKGSLVDYLNKYSDNKLDPKAKINFMDYDWGLNEQE